MGKDVYPSGAALDRTDQRDGFSPAVATPLGDAFASLGLVGH